MKYTKLIIWLFLILQLLFLSTKLTAQEKQKHEISTDSFQSFCEDKTEVFIDANRGEIDCISYDGDSLLVEIKIISNHTDKSIAKADLEKMKLIKDKIGSKIYLRNYLELKRDEDKPSSDIRVYYSIKVPYHTKIELTNFFGKIKVNGDNMNVKIVSDYCPININSFEGELIIESTFGDIKAMYLEGTIKIKSNRSNIIVNELSGELSLNSKIADVRIEKLKDILGLKIHADKSKLFLSVSEIDNYSYDFDLKKSQLDLPKTMRLEYKKNEKNEIKALYNSGQAKSLLFIKLSIGTLTIKTDR
jgi:hypothetical protein